MNLDNLPILSMLIWLPILGGIWTLIIGDQQERVVKHFSFIISISTFLLSVLLYYQFDNDFLGMQFVEEFYWIESFSIKYHLGVDGIALPLIILTTFTTILVIVAAWEVIDKNISYYMCSFLVLTGLMNGVFVALDSILFYVFWEAMLIPMFLIIGIWGGPNRVYATIKFFLYTLFGSVLMLLGILALYFFNMKSGTGSLTFSLTELYLVGPKIPLSLQVWIFLAFFIGFAIKVPMFPFHTWLPDAHVEAPTAGSVILAGILLKMGTYGFVRFVLPLLPEATQLFVPFMVLLSIIGIIYGALVAMAQTDIKKLVAYSSVSHLGFVMLGVFALNEQGLIGGQLQMINHGISTGAVSYTHLTLPTKA